MTPEVTSLLADLQDGRPVLSHDMTVVHAQIEGRPVRFAVDMENDPVQRNHRLGQFYEGKELRSLRAVFPEGGVFVDAGANVGNHGLYAALFLGAGMVVPIEPNPLAFRLLIQNVLLNGLLHKFDLTKLGVGLSDSEADGFAMEARERNLGAAKMLPGEGDLQVFSGDALFADIAPDFIKIDTEGMELAVLRGLEQTIAKHKPVLLVEVDNANEQAFLEIMEAAGYKVAETIQRYRLNKNYLMRPVT